MGRGTTWCWRGTITSGEIEMIDININELRRVAQAATPGPDGVSLNWVKLLQDFQKEANPAAVSELLNRLEAAESSVAWHRRRWMALQMHQMKMREPERTMVCDILANGELMHPTVAGDRYAIKDALEKSK